MTFIIWVLHNTVEDWNFTLDLYTSTSPTEELGDMQLWYTNGSAASMNNTYIGTPIISIESVFNLILLSKEAIIISWIRGTWTLSTCSPQLQVHGIPNLLVECVGEKTAVVKLLEWAQINNCKADM